ncbi:hypothetical protein OPT61_g8857 [Boeremia exigua]|uniref:Uncharacterized protein n=1 Tax=Boeremia exigua TaxID=749465 RepID=A0ACC2HX46_9PLEO|nr:hypothetical protein OPT61_g8857 [Boeremia exigua]
MASSTPFSQHSRLGDESPAFTYGTAWKKDQTKFLVKEALRQGFRRIDTAAQPKHYQERLVGEALREAYTEGTVSRQDVYVQTKYTTPAGQDLSNMPYDPAAPLETQIRTSVASSLKNLRPRQDSEEGSHLDCLLLHSPLPTLPQTLEAWKLLESYVPHQIKTLGISNVTLPVLREIYNVSTIKPSVVQNRFYPQTRYDGPLRAFCREHGITYQSFWTLTGNSNLVKSKPVVELAQAAEVSVPTALYALVMDLGVEVLNGTTSAEHMQEDLLGVRKTFTEEEPCLISGFSESNNTAAKWPAGCGGGPTMQETLLLVYDIPASLPIPTQPWEAARNRFLEGLPPHETSIYENATLENLFYDASANQKRHARGSRSWRLQERLAPLTESLEDYSKALDVYVAAEAAKFQESLVNMLAQIGDVLPRFRIYEKIFKNHERLLVAISAAYLDVLQFCVESKTFFLKARRSKKAGLAHMIESARTRDIEVQTRALQIRSAKFEKRNRILASLPAVDYLSKQAALSNIKHPETCKWLLGTSIFQTWHTKDSSTCVTCYGIPGSGKSVLAASVRDFLAGEITNNDSTLVCHYYCDYADIKSLSSTHVLASIVKQALEHLPLDHFGDEFESPYRDDRPLPTPADGSEYLLGLMSTFEVTYLILDGLDELDPDNQSQVLSLIDFLIQQAANTVKIFTTSRTGEFHIKEALKVYPAFSLAEMDVNKDIATFVEGEMSKINAPHPLFSDLELRDEVIKALVKGAKGMFLWARFQVIEIKEALTKSDLRTTLEHLPKDINEIYLRIIRKIFQSPGGQARLGTMQKVFCWIAVARRPLTVDELEECIALEPTDTFLHTDRIPWDAGIKLVGDCGNLAVINESDNTVSFAHHTVRQFLLSYPGGEIFGWVDLTTSETDLGNICLAYLSFSDFDTQVAKAPDKAHLAAPLAERVLWLNVPFAARIQDMLTWIVPRRANSERQKPESFSFAVPLPYTPTEVLTKKYALLDYIIENWVYHTSHLRPSSVSWTQFQYVALYRQLDFEFRPWNDSTHQRNVEAVTSKLKRTLMEKKATSSPWSKDTYHSQLAIYGWALSRAVGSLFSLLDREIMGVYFDTVRADIPDVSDQTIWDLQYNDVDVFFGFPQDLSGDRASMRSRQQTEVWSGELTVKLYGIAFAARGTKSSRLFCRVLRLELIRWKGANAWKEIMIATAVSAMQHGAKAVLDCTLEDLEVDLSAYDPRGTYWQQSDSFKIFEGLLRGAASNLLYTRIEWNIILLMMRYLTGEQLSGLARLSPTCKANANISHALLVTALANKMPLKSIHEIWVELGLRKDQVPGFHLVGNWKESPFGSITAFWVICPFIGRNAFALMEDLDGALSCFNPQTLGTDADFTRGIAIVVDIWKR